MTFGVSMLSNTNRSLIEWLPCVFSCRAGADTSPHPDAGESWHPRPGGSTARMLARPPRSLYGLSLAWPGPLASCGAGRAPGARTWPGMRPLLRSRTTMTPMILRAGVLLLPRGLVRTRRRRLGDRKGRQRQARDVPAQQLHDVAQERRLVRGHQRHGLAGGTGARRATDAVHVILRHVRQLVVDHVRQLLDVEPARRHFGGDQRHDLVVLE